MFLPLWCNGQHIKKAIPAGIRSANVSFFHDKEEELVRFQPAAPFYASEAKKRGPRPITELSRGSTCR